MICLIDSLPEGLDSNAPHGLQELLVLTVALAHIHLEQFADRVRHAILCYRGTQHFSERGGTGWRAADGDLIPLLAVLIDAENADMAHVMMPAGVHAARHLDLDRNQVVRIA